MSELAVATGQERRVVTLGGREYELRPLTVRVFIELERKFGAFADAFEVTDRDGVKQARLEGIAYALYQCARPVSGERVAFEDFAEIEPMEMLEVFNQYQEFLAGKGVTVTRGPRSASTS